MATIRQRKLKSGETIFDIQVKVKDSLTHETVVKATTWKAEGKMTPKQQEHACSLYARKFEDSVKQLYSNSTGEVLDYNIKFNRCAALWLERVKRDFSLGYYEMNIKVVEKINRYLGQYKMREITPFIIQSFYDRIDEEKRVITSVCANANLRKVMEQKNILYKNFRYDYQINSGSLSHALSGKNVSLEYAKSMADILDVPVEEVFTITQKEQPYSTDTTSKIKRATRCIFSFALRQGVVEKNYATAEYVSYGRKQHKDIVCLDDREAKQLFLGLLNYADIRAKTAVMLILMTGIRRGEAAGLEWKDIDYERQAIYINRVSAYSPSKGIYTKEPKTEGSVRRIAVSEVVVHQLIEYKKWYEEQRENWGNRWVNSDRLFVQEYGKPINPDTIRFWQKKLLKTIKMPYVTVHSLRHTNITLQITSGVPIVTVAGRAGHSRTSTTTDIYSKFIKSSDEAAAETLENLLVPNTSIEEE